MEVRNADIPICLLYREQFHLYKLIMPNLISFKEKQELTLDDEKLYHNI